MTPVSGKSKTVKGVVIGCRTLSIRRDPDPDTEMDDWFSQIHNPKEIIKEVPRGTVLEVDPSQVYYDAWGRGFYKIWTEMGQEGYVPTTAVKMKEEKDVEQIDS